MEAKNYRGLCIGSSFLKLAMAIILERIKPWYNSQLMPNQYGFRKNVGCPDAIFTLQSIHHNTSRINRETFLLFVDLTAAYMTGVFENGCFSLSIIVLTLMII